MKNKLIILTLVLAVIAPASIFASTYGIQTTTSGCIANQVLPDSACTPGAVLTTNINLICKSGYTKTVRNVSLSKKKQVFVEYGIPYSKHQNYEVDHLIALEIGGSNDISNLWPESSLIRNGSSVKDKFENYLHAQVCSGKLSISDAQAEISSSWLKYYVPSLTTKSDASGAATNKINIPNPATKPQATPGSETYSNTVPVGATARCYDGTYSFSQSRRGTCSHHGGVSQWLY